MHVLNPFESMSTVLLMLHFLRARISPTESPKRTRGRLHRPHCELSRLSLQCCLCPLLPTSLPVCGP